MYLLSMRSRGGILTGNGQEIGTIVALAGETIILTGFGREVVYPLYRYLQKSWYSHWTEAGEVVFSEDIGKRLYDTESIDGVLTGHGQERWCINLAWLEHVVF